MRERSYTSKRNKRSRVVTKHLKNKQKMLLFSNAVVIFVHILRIIVI